MLPTHNNTNHSSVKLEKSQPQNNNNRRRWNIQLLVGGRWNIQLLLVAGLNQLNKYVLYKKNKDILSVYNYCCHLNARTQIWNIVSPLRGCKKSAQCLENSELLASKNQFVWSGCKRNVPTHNLRTLSLQFLLVAIKLPVSVHRPTPVPPTSQYMIC